MSLEPEQGSPQPTPSRTVDPRIVLGIALAAGSLAAYCVDWKTAFLAFIAVITLFTPRPNSS